MTTSCEGRSRAAALTRHATATEQTATRDDWVLGRDEILTRRVRNTAGDCDGKPGVAEEDGDDDSALIEHQPITSKHRLAELRQLVDGLDERFSHAEEEVPETVRQDVLDMLAGLHSRSPPSGSGRKRRARRG